MLLNSSRWSEVPVTTTRPVSSVEPLKWGAFAGLSLNDNQLPTGDLNFGRIMHNRFSQCGCGLYLVAKIEEESSNDLLVANNSFTSIDPINFYHNSDTHAIGIQGGQRNVYEYNRIDRVGGSGLTFFAWHNLSLSHTLVRYNIISNVWNDDQARFHKLQRGIEFDSGAYSPAICRNNTVSYNVLQNIGTAAFRSKATVPVPRGDAADGGLWSWRWLNNVVINASVNFESRYSSAALPHGDLVANNLFLYPRVHHQDGVIPGHNAEDTDLFTNNGFWPAAGTPDNKSASLFCFGGSDPPIDAKNWSTNCSSFEEWVAHFPSATLKAATMKILDPLVSDNGEGSVLPDAARPMATAALGHAGKELPYGVVLATHDIDGRALGSRPPSIGAFQLKTDDAVVRTEVPLPPRISPPGFMALLLGSSDKRGLVLRPSNCTLTKPGARWHAIDYPITYEQTYTNAGSYRLGTNPGLGGEVCSLRSVCTGFQAPAGPGSPCKKAASD